MRSSAGLYFEKLDHLRALAAFMVFSWHFVHADQIVPTSYVPCFVILAVFEEGHTGVSLFMTLSGYLFFKLLDGRRIIYSAFIWNRFIRLAPLLLVVMAARLGQEALAEEGDWVAFLLLLLNGIVLPTWPNGGWSITVELHFYILLPLLLKLQRLGVEKLLLVVLSAILLRVGLWLVTGEVQSLAYWTIIGRIDQFVLGGFFFHAFKGRKNVDSRLLLACAITFLGFYSWFNFLGGFYNIGGYPTSNSIWIYLTTVEGAFYGLLIAFYEKSDFNLPEKISRAVAMAGEASYSMYLLHFFFVFHAARLLGRLEEVGGNYYLMFLASLVLYILCCPMMYLIYRYFERPILSLRKRYIATD